VPTGQTDRQGGLDVRCHLRSIIVNVPHRLLFSNTTSGCLDHHPYRTINESGERRRRGLGTQRPSADIFWQDGSSSSTSVTADSTRLLLQEPRRRRRRRRRRATSGRTASSSHRGSANVSDHDPPAPPPDPVANNRNTAETAAAGGSDDAPLWPCWEDLWCFLPRRLRCGQAAKFTFDWFEDPATVTGSLLCAEHAGKLRIRIPNRITLLSMIRKYRTQ
jgi:hypothetical protein